MDYRIKNYLNRSWRQHNENTALNNGMIVEDVQNYHSPNTDQLTCNNSISHSAITVVS